MSDSPFPPYQDDDQRLGGADSPVMLETLHENAERVKAQLPIYVVEQLEDDISEADDITSWRSLGRFEARSGREAIRMAAQSYDLGDRATLRALATRYITQLEMTTTTRLELS